MQAAEISKAGQLLVIPIRFCARHADDGKNLSGAEVARTIASMSFGSRPAELIASIAAFAARVDVLSFSAIRLSVMPVLETIQSWDVSTNFSIS